MNTYCQLSLSSMYSSHLLITTGLLAFSTRKWRLNRSKTTKLPPARSLAREIKVLPKKHSSEERSSTARWTWLFLRTNKLWKYSNKINQQIKLLKIKTPTILELMISSVSLMRLYESKISILKEIDTIKNQNSIRNDNLNLKNKHSKNN